MHVVQRGQVIILWSYKGREIENKSPKDPQVQFNSNFQTSGWEFIQGSAEKVNRKVLKNLIRWLINI